MVYVMIYDYIGLYVWIFEFLLFGSVWGRLEGMVLLDEGWLLGKEINRSVM